MFRMGIVSVLVAMGFVTATQSTVYAHPEGMVYPVIGDSNYSDTFLAYRAGQVDNKHHAIDIFAPKHSKIVSPVDGTILYVGYPEDSWGWYIVIKDNDGYEYHFIHINNDTPGTDDGRGGAMHAYAPDMKSGNRVVKGQYIAYVGDSGNAETTPPHLHFEIIHPDYTHMNYRDVPLAGFVNPYPYLNRATHISTPALYPALPGEILPYGPRAGMEASIAKGNLDDDPQSEVVVGAGRGGGPHVKVYKADGTFTGREFMAYDPYFHGGIDVAVGDITGDGKAEIITGAGYGGGPHVRAFDQTGKEVASFYAYDPRFAGGIRVAAGDVDGDGKAEIITGIQRDGGPHVRVFRQDGSVVGEYFAYTPKFTGGIDVAAGDVNADGKDEIVTGAGVGGGPHVKITRPNGNDLSNGGFYAFDHRFAGGIKVSVGEVNSRNAGEEIAVAPWSGGGPNIRTFRGNGTLLTNTNYMEVWWSGRYDVAADRQVHAATGWNRRTSIRSAVEYR